MFGLLLREFPSVREGLPGTLVLTPLAAMHEKLDNLPPCPIRVHERKVIIGCSGIPHVLTGAYDVRSRSLSAVDRLAGMPSYRRDEWDEIAPDWCIGRASILRYGRLS